MSGGTLTYNVTISVGMMALLYLNYATIKEGGETLQVGKNGILSIVNTSKTPATIGVGSGTHSFIGSYVTVSLRQTDIQPHKNPT